MTPPTHRFRSIIDTFIPSTEAFEREDIRFKARILITICMVMGVILCVASAAFGLLVNQDLFRRLLNAAIMLPLAALYFFIPYWLRKTGQLAACSQLFIVMTFVSIAGGISITGGPIESSAAGMMVVPPLLGFCLQGRRTGLYWAAISFVTMTVLSFLA